ncbi:formylglycine-generating enzyme family protein [Pseudoduganella plicata]|nr:SUMF1/EgtB/PvdO family nonheme iron enzyme [Pseudoduganella plicata]
MNSGEIESLFMSLHRKVLPLPAVFCCLIASAHASSVKPPKIPAISKQYVDEEKLVALKQPAALAAELEALGKGTIDERVARLKKKILTDLIFVEGGTFQMGDFGPIWSPDKLPYSDDPTNKPVHEVTLSSFSIAKYKTTFAEFDVYTEASGTERAASDKAAAKQRYPAAPAGVSWQRAKDYCQWLGNITGQPFDLPTEAQWEYAARSRGQFFVWATDNGNVDFGRNIPAAGQVKLLTPSGSQRRYPVGLFPPNPLGLYDVSHDNEEWVNDWFDKDYYQRSPKHDPKGPAGGTMKVARGWPVSDSIVPNTMHRRARPMELPAEETEDLGTISPNYLSQGLRCAVQKSEKIH